MGSHMHRVAITLSLSLTFCMLGYVDGAGAQTSGPPTATCHVTDGTFSACPDGQMEWSDVEPTAFPDTNSYLYVNQDAGHNFLYLMYDFPFRTSQIAPSDSVHVRFDTVEQGAAGPTLLVYDIYIFGNGTMQVLEQGQPTPPGRIVGAAGFGASQNSASPHLMAELQVPLTPGPPTAYSPDPLFWSADVPPPPTSPPPPPPPDPCPTDPGKTYNRCVKAELNNAQANAAEMAAAVGLAAGLCSSVGALACAPLEPVMLITAAVWTATAIELGRKLGADPPGVNFAVPPDPNFTVIAQPATYSLVIPTTGLTPQQAAAFDAFALTAQQLIALEQAETASLARVEGASLAGNAVWVSNQMQAARTFGSQSGVLIGELPGLLANIGSAIAAAGTQFTFTSADVLNFQAAIDPLSAASEVQQQFVLAQQLVVQQLGISSADQALMVPLLLSVDPQAVATLGIGAFPPSLSDPSLPTTFQQLGTGLVQNAPSLTSLQPSFQFALPGDYVSAGVGLRGVTTGPLNISGIPAGADVVRALLYWGMLDNGLEPSLNQMSFAGAPISGSLVGSGPDTCWGRTNSFTFRADVTPLVTGNNTYALSGVAAGGNILAEGASLVVIYQLDGAPFKTVIVADGNVSIPFGTSTGTASFNGFTTQGPVSAATTFMVGDGQAAQFGITTPVTFTGSLGSLSLPGLFASKSGPLWDNATFDVSSVVGPGSTSDSATIRIAGDCLLWSAQAFSVTSVAATAPVIATAAVVQAGLTGDTLVNVRNVAPSDAPTIQDEVGLIVQFRTIHNPSTSATTLVNQLVNGLVSDGIISTSQASDIQTSVLQQVVLPAGQPTISGRVASHEVQSPGIIEVDVQVSDIGAGNATNTTIAQLALRTLRGTGTVTVNTALSPALPLNIGDLPVGAASTVKLFLNVPSGVSRFSVTENGTVDDIRGQSFNFSTSQVVVP
jgi:hypothetical protein